MAIVHYDSKYALNGWKWLDEKEIVAYNDESYIVCGDIPYLLKNGKFTNCYRDNSKIPFFDNARFYKDKHNRVYLVFHEYLPHGQTEPTENVVNWCKEHGLTIKRENENWVARGVTTFIIYHGE